MIALWLAIQILFSTNTLGGWMDIPPVVPTPVPESTPGAADIAAEIATDLALDLDD